MIGISHVSRALLAAPVVAPLSVALKNNRVGQKP